MGSTVADWLPLLPQCKDVLWSDSNLKRGFCIFSQCLQGFPSGPLVSSESGELDTQNSALWILPNVYWNELENGWICCGISAEGELILLFT